MPQNKPLTFEEFVARDSALKGHPKVHPRYDNFPMHFMRESMFPQLRETPHFLKLREEHLDLESRLTDAVSNLNRPRDKAEALKPYEPDLYQAYLILHNYGVPDEDLLVGPK